MFNHRVNAQIESISFSPQGVAIKDFTTTSDGNTLIYIANTNSKANLIAVSLSDGIPRQLNPAITTGRGVQDFAISPDGTKVAYTLATQASLSTASELLIIPTSGGSPMTLLSSQVAVGDVQFTPDGNSIIYQGGQVSSLPQGQIISYDLFSIPVGGGSPLQISHSKATDRSVHAFTINADGSRVVYEFNSVVASIQELYSVAITGGAAVKLAPDSGSSLRHHELSADGNYVVFMATNSVGTNLFSIPITGGSAVQINTSLPQGRNVSLFKISPDNNHVVYSADQNTQYLNEIFSVPISGGSPVQLNSGLISGDIFDFDFTADGSKVIYLAAQNTANIEELFSVPTTGGTSVRLNTPTTTDGVIEFDIGADPSLVVYMTRTQVFQVTADGATSPAELTSGPVTNTFLKDLQLSPDGSNATLIRNTSSTRTQQVVFISIATGSMSTTQAFSHPAFGEFDFPQFFSPINVLQFLNNNTSLFIVNNGYTLTSGFLLTFSSGLSSATLDSPTQITVTFNDDVQTNGGNPTDFTVTDGIGNTFAVGAQADGTAGDAEIILTVADVTTAVGDLTVTYTNNNDEISILTTGDPVGTDDIGVIIDADMMAPTLVSAMKDSDTQITLTFSELVQTSGSNPTAFTVIDGTGTNFAVSVQADGTAEDTDIVLTVADLSTAVGDLTVTYTNNSNEISDFGENHLASDATGVSIDTDNTAPTLTSVAKDNDTQITVTLSEAVQTNGTNPTDFTVTDGLGADFAVSAQADGTAQDTDIVLTVADLSSAVGDLKVIYTNNNNEISDFGGNDLATDVTGVSIDTDMTAPTLVGAVKDSDTQITITLSEQVQTNGTNPVDFTVTDGLGAAYTVIAQADGTANDTDIVLTVADLSSAVGDLTVTYTNTNNEISDFGENNLATDVTGVVIDVDVTAPAFVSAVKDSDTQITITFSEPVQTNGTNPADFTIVDDNSTPFMVSTQADGTGEDNQIVLTVADLSTAVTQLTITYVNNNNEISDFGGNDMATDATGVVILLDVIPPDVTLSTTAADPNSGAFDITATFTEDVMNVATSDFNVTNGTAKAITGSGGVYTVTITPAADGTVTVDLPANTVQDLANNDNTASNTITLENDETAPTVTVTSVASDPTSGAFNITATFSESVTGFDVNDLMVSNGAAGNFAGSGTVYTATITPAADGSVTVDINAGAGQDAATNGNMAATQFSITNDETSPSVTISTMDNDPTSGAFTATFTFDENVTGFALGDITVANGVASNFMGSGAVYTAIVTPLADGTVTIDVGGTVAQDAAGNDNTAATQFSIVNDETLPTVIITSIANDPIDGAFDITITFSEEVTGFDITDLSVANGTAGNFTGSGATYTATITPVTDGAVTIDIASAAAQDVATNDNVAATPFSILADLTAPDAPIITGISDDTGSDTNDGITNDNTLSFIGTAEANSIVEVFVDGSSIGSTMADGSGDWTLDHSASMLADASYNLAANATDAAGNTSTLSAVYGVTIDTTLPQKVGMGSITDDTGISNSDAITSDDLVIFYGTAEPFSVVSLEAQNFVFVTAVADANGDWVADFTNRSLGLGVTVTSTSVDAAGNVSPISDPFVLVIDKIAPQVTGITRNDVNPTAASSVDYTVTFDEEVHGLSTSNFGLAFTGTQNAGIASISASSGTSITVTVNNITGEGTFGLNLSDITGITDVAGNDLAGTFTGEVYSTNFTPTDITLSASSILENNTIGDMVATLSTTDADGGDSHTYSLVAGTGDTDNASFTISGDELQAAESFDLETKGSYDLRIQTDDGRGGIYAEAFTITIDNVPEADLRITGNNDIPATPLGIATSFDITIHNDGDATLTVGSILYPTAFGGPVTGISVAPASSQVVTMTFTPTVAQLYTGDITINSNGGTGTLAVSADGAIITGTDDGLLKAESINLYPNPATDIVTIDLSKYNGKPLDIQLYDMSGTKAFGISQYKEATLKLDVSGYHNGLYLVQFTDGKSTVQKKIMIRK